MKPRKITLFIVMFLVFLKAQSAFADWGMNSFGVDVCEYKALGYNEDLSHFAIEEFCTSDAMYYFDSTITVVDLFEDKIVSEISYDTGDRCENDPERVECSVSYVRNSVRKRIDLNDLGFSELSYRLVAANPILQSLEDRKNSTKLIWQPNGFVRGEPIELSINTISFENPKAGCYTSNPDEKNGYTLSINGREAYRDTHVPTSRGCPQAYELEAVFCPIEKDLLFWPPQASELCISLIRVVLAVSHGETHRWLIHPFKNLVNLP